MGGVTPFTVKIRNDCVSGILIKSKGSAMGEAELIHPHLHPGEVLELREPDMSQELNQFTQL